MECKQNVSYLLCFINCYEVVVYMYCALPRTVDNFLLLHVVIESLLLRSFPVSLIQFYRMGGCELMYK